MAKVLNQKLPNHFGNTIFSMTTDELFTYLDKIGVEERGKETIIKGYKIKVGYKGISPQAMQDKKERIVDIISKANRGKKD